MNMPKIIVKLYVKNNKKPISIMELDNEDLLDELLNKLNDSNKFIRYYQLILNREEFERAEIIYK